MARYVVEIEPEVRQWLDSLSDHDYGRAEFYADLLADNADTLGEPSTERSWRRRNAKPSMATR